MGANRMSSGKMCIVSGISVLSIYVVCVILDVAVPGLAMVSTLFVHVPAFPLPTPYTVLIGLAGSFLAGALLAAVIVPLHNAYFYLRDRLEERGAVIHGDRLRYF